MDTTYTNDPAYQGLLRDIVERPFSAEPRGVLRDWLEDHGRDNRVAAMLYDEMPVYLVADQVRWRRAEVSGQNAIPGEVITGAIEAVSCHLDPLECERGTQVIITQGMLTHLLLQKKEEQFIAQCLIPLLPILGVRLGFLRPKRDRQYVGRGRSETIWYWSDVQIKNPKLFQRLTGKRWDRIDANHTTIETIARYPSEEAALNDFSDILINEVRERHGLRPIYWPNRLLPDVASLATEPATTG